MNAKDLDGQLKLKNLEIESLKNKIQELQQQVESDSTKANTAEKSVKDIALKAIENSTKVQIIDNKKTEKE